MSYEFDNPISLKEICLTTICDNLSTVFDEHFSGSDIRENTLEPSLKPQPRITYKFKNPSWFLLNELSEKLLMKLGERGLLTDETLSLFNGHNTKLKKVKIKLRSIEESISLSVLAEHKLKSLECVNLVDIPKVLHDLGKDNVVNLHSLNVSGCTFIGTRRYNLMVVLTNLKNLRQLNVSYTEFNQQALNIVCEDLVHLDTLDISGTFIQDIQALLLLKDKLVSLNMSDLNTFDMATTIPHLHLLHHLDIRIPPESEASLPPPPPPPPSSSSSPPSHHYQQQLTPPRLEEILHPPHALPHLRYLDVSGRRVTSPAHVTRFLGGRAGRVRYLGAVFSEYAGSGELREVLGEECTVAGLCNEAQVMVTLRKYYGNGIYAQKALYHLFQLSRGFSTARGDIVEQVVRAMGEHRLKYGVQVAATACLYNLTRGELSKGLHPRVLGTAVTLTLDAMEVFQEEYQLQKNALLTLCSDRILQDVTFDRFKCAKLVLNSLCAFGEVDMNRMAVAICSILAAKVTTSETSELGSKPEYMQKLLTIVYSRVQRSLSDITLKFTLSALWNLSDESAATCRVFLELDGAELFLQLLVTFENDSAIETKVLGLLNNIAEVAELRKNLMKEAYIVKLFSLLKSPFIDVSYFAAGIVAHLASDGEHCWQISQHSRSDMLTELQTAVLEWKVPDNEMVSYRSFKPFFPLLLTYIDYRVQLWAVWAIHHVCTKNPKRYCLMLKEENGILLLKDIVQYEESNDLIKTIASQILQTVDSNL